MERDERSDGRSAMSGAMRVAMSGAMRGGTYGDTSSGTEREALGAMSGEGGGGLALVATT